MGDGITHGNRRPDIEDLLEHAAAHDSLCREALKEINFWKHANWSKIARIQALEAELKAAQEALHG